MRTHFLAIHFQSRRTSIQKTTAENQKADQVTIVDPTKSSSIGDQYSMAVNDQDNPLELKYFGKEEAWVDCSFCHSRVKTRIEKHTRKEDVAWTSFAFLFSFLYMSGLFTSVHTFTHYCSACEEAIAVRKPGSRFAQTLEQSEVKAHGSQ
ncbi:hypothetical protein FJTKL_07191 [Diaporthe vaccinii]|uniref:LITAF domain-containing protein n=1 Tax=Diaporthe vaccinii TaxID=105482 RepID=A0ABR4DPF6_9PEZI